MTTMSSNTASAERVPGPGEGPETKGPGNRVLFDLGGVDRSARVCGREAIERINPHRGQMALLDGIVWTNPEYTRGVAIKHVRADEFWVPGHFPERPMFPGVLMVEAGAQLACYLYNIRHPGPRTVAFLRIEECTFRSMVKPGDDLFILAQQIKCGRRRFISDIQGLVGDRIAFDARISGMSLAEGQGE